MPTEQPRTALESVTRRRFLISRWPWRSLGYLLTAAPLAFTVALPLWALGIPFAELVTSVTARDYRQLALLLFLSLIGAVLIATIGPLVAIPLAAVERKRLRIVDDRPAVSAHRAAPTGAWSWLRTRYTEAATWRELCYACLLGIVVPVLDGFLLLALYVIAVFASPLFVVLLPAVPYLLAVVAGAHGAVARALLTRASNERFHAELVEVSRSRARLVDAFEAERRR